MKILIRIVFLLNLLLVFSQCKKDHSVLGVDVQPKGDALSTSYSDTSTIYAFTIKYDSTLSANTRYKFLGSNLDPVFGRMDVGLYVNTSMNLTYLDFGADAKILSSELVFVLNALYRVGDPTAQITYSVYGINTTLNPALFYYTDNTRQHDSRILLGTVTTSFTSLDGKLVIRIPINTSYAGAVLNNPSYLINNDTYQAAYKGFYITCAGTSVSTSSPGVIYQCDLEDDLSGFYLYYQNGTPSATKTDKSFKFAFEGVTAVKYNTVNYVPAQGGVPNLLQQIVNHDSIQAPQEDLYLRGMGVTKVKIFIPSIKHFADSSRIAINRAELILNVDQTFLDSNYPVPPTLALLPMDSLGRETYALDQVDNARYDGNYDSISHRFVFNIARFAGLVAGGKLKNYGFYLVIANTDLIYASTYDGPSKELALVERDNFIERVVICGNNKGILKPKFNLSYVKLKN